MPEIKPPVHYNENEIQHSTWTGCFDQQSIKEVLVTNNTTKVTCEECKKMMPINYAILHKDPETGELSILGMVKATDRRNAIYIATFFVDQGKIKANLADLALVEANTAMYTN